MVRIESEEPGSGLSPGSVWSVQAIPFYKFQPEDIDFDESREY